MGKYMRGRREAGGDEVAAVEVVGVRTRSRAASAAGVAAGGRVAKVVPKRRKALPPSTVTALTAEPAAVGSGGGDGGSCYLHLRSRMLFKAPPAASPQKPPSAAAEAAGAAGSPLPAGLSRCSSTASSIDVSAHQERSAAYRSDAAEAGGDHVVREGSVCNSGCGQQDRERREATPSSQARGELSDLESDLAGQKRSLPAAASPVRVIVKPPAAELEKFFAASEAADAERFSSKYNFDVVRGVPLDAGRFEWTPVVSN